MSTARFSRVRVWIAGYACALVLCASAAAQQATLTVPAAANIFAAGQTTAFDGQLPPLVRFAAGAGKQITFTSVTGEVRWTAGGALGGPDGAVFSPHSTNIVSREGISGIVHGRKVMFLVGVFLDEATPAPPAPARLDFTRTESFAALAPTLGQTFFVGDGLTGTNSGARQRFVVPVAATRLFLGFAEAPNFYGGPGGYADNTGSLTASLEIETPAGEIGVLTTVAGTGVSGFGGDGGPATAARLGYPTEVLTDGAWNLYIADSGNHRIRPVRPEGVIETVAGTGRGGDPGDGAPATQSMLYQPWRLALDAAGNLYFSEVLANRVRKVNTGGIIEAVAGSGAYGSDPDGVPVLEARLEVPYGLAVDRAGRIYLADSGNHKVRRVTTQGLLETFAGTGTPGDRGDGSSAATAQLNDPDGLAVDRAGNFYIADAGNHKVRKVNTLGTISTVAGTGQPGYGGDGGSASAALLRAPRAVAVDAAGNLYIAERENHRVRRVTPDGKISTLAGTGSCGRSGDGGPARLAQLCEPLGVAVDSEGSVYIADAGNHSVRKVSFRRAAPAPVISTSGRLPAGTLGHDYSASLAGTGETLPLIWSLSAGALPAGLSLAPDTGVISGMPTARGTFAFSVRLMDGLGQAVVQPLTLEITPGALRVSPASLAFKYTLGGAVPGPQTVALSSVGGVLRYTTRTSAAWLRVSPTSGSTPAELSVSVNPVGLPVDTHNGEIIVTAEGVGSYPVPVQLTVMLGERDGLITAVVHGAHWAAGPVPPGGFVAIFGWKLGPERLVLAEREGVSQIATTLAGTQVFFDGIPAPVLYTQASQVGAIVPYAMAGLREARVQVRYGEIRSNVWTVSVAPSAPGLFTADSSGRGPGAILNQDYSLNTADNPAAVGSVVMLFACGAGETNPMVADGLLATAEVLPQPRLPVSAAIGGRLARVEYAGSSVGQPVGLLQVNVVVPAGTAAGRAVPVVLTVGQATSQAGVTLAVR